MNFYRFLNILTEASKVDHKGMHEHDFADAGITVLVSIIVVFLVLIIIVLITHFLFLGINKTSEAIDKSDSKFARFLKRKRPVKNVEQTKSTAPMKVEITDDDMMAAVLVATIDYQQEVKTDVRVVSVKEIK